MVNVNPQEPPVLVLAFVPGGPGQVGVQILADTLGALPPVARLDCIAAAKATARLMAEDVANSVEAQSGGKIKRDRVLSDIGERAKLIVEQVWAQATKMKLAQTEVDALKAKEAKIEAKSAGGIIVTSK